MAFDVAAARRWAASALTLANGLVRRPRQTTVHVNALARLKWFDVRRSVCTLTAEEFRHIVRHGAFADLPVRTRDFHQLFGLDSLKRRDLAFVDLGAGQGKAMLLALDAGFRHVVGVELSEWRVDHANRNFQQGRRRVPSGAVVEISAGDAAGFSVPDRDVVLFLFNPFGADVLADVLRRLDPAPSGIQRTVWIAYLNPRHHEVIDADARFELLSDVAAR